MRGKGKSTKAIRHIMKHSCPTNMNNPSRIRLPQTRSFDESQSSWDVVRGGDFYIFISSLPITSPRQNLRKTTSALLASLTSTSLSSSVPITVPILGQRERMISFWTWFRTSACLRLAVVFESYGGWRHTTISHSGCFSIIRTATVPPRYPAAPSMKIRGVVDILNGLLLCMCLVFGTCL